jgi:hypothetical protein
MMMMMTTTMMKQEVRMLLTVIKGVNISAKWEASGWSSSLYSFWTKMFIKLGKSSRIPDLYCSNACLDLGQNTTYCD